MDKKVICVLLLINSLAIGVIIQSVNANPYLEHKIAPPPEDAKAFTIMIASPKENAVYADTNDVALVYNVIAPKSQTALTTYITRVQYRGDWMPNAEYAYKQNFTSPEFPAFLEFSLNLTRIPDGRHSIIIYADGGGGYAEGLTWYNFDMNSSSSVNFIIGEETLATPQHVSAHYYVNAVINVDGTVDPATTPIQHVGDTYILTGDMGSLEVKRSNLILDGNGHTLPGLVTFYDETIKENVTIENSGGISLNKVANVTVKNFLIKDSKIGIFLDQSKNCIISNNTITGTKALFVSFQTTAGIYIWSGNSNIVSRNQITNNYNGIYIGNAEQNVLLENDIRNNTCGVSFWNASNNIAYINNFFNNIKQVQTETDSINIWDSEKKGNYWTDYAGNDTNRDGIGDTPYIIDEKNQDYYPLMVPFDAASQPEPIPVALLAAGSSALIIAVGACLIVYFKKHRH